MGVRNPFGEWVNFNLGYVRRVAPAASYDCEDATSWWCADEPDAFARFVQAIQEGSTRWI